MSFFLVIINLMHQFLSTSFKQISNMNRLPLSQLQKFFDKFSAIKLLVFFSIVPQLGYAAALPSATGSVSEHATLLLIIYVTIALVTSFLCSIAEAVLLSITPSYIESLKDRDESFAKRLYLLKVVNVDRSLAAILTLNTIAHTVGALGAGSQATAVFGSAWFGVFSGVMTILVLVLSEIIPKTIGAVYWQKLTLPTVWYVTSLVKLLFPIVWASEQITKIISRGGHSQAMSREEFLAMARAGEQTGEIGSNESRIIKNLMQLNSLSVTDVMTPATVISAMKEETELEEAFAIFEASPFSRWPIYSDDINNITGFVLRSEVFLSFTSQTNSATNDQQDQAKRLHIKQAKNVQELKRPIRRVMTHATVSNALEMFLREKLHIAIVTDEHGSTRGLVTLEDLIETLIGVEIIDEGDKVEDMRQLARKLWEDRAKALGVPEKH